MYKFNGFTLLECCTCLCILTVSCCLALPMFNTIEKAQLAQEATSMRALISMARNQAMSTSSEVTVCSLNLKGECSTQWQESATVFLDANANRALDQGEQVLNSTQWSPETQVQWRGMGKKGALHFSGVGITQVSNGTLRISRSKHSIKIIVNRQGRVRSVTEH